MTEILHKTVVLVGMMGAGKTAIGTELARLLGVPFVDSDDEIVRAANMTIPEIFARDGEAFFRLKEAQVIARLLGGPPGILSVGGGAFLSAETRARITAQGISVWLRADLELLWTRVRQKSSRPLLRTANPRQTLAELLAQRDPVYALADLTVDARAEYSITEMAGQVRAALRARPDVVQVAGAERGASGLGVGGVGASGAGATGLGADRATSDRPAPVQPVRSKAATAHAAKTQREGRVPTGGATHRDPLRKPAPGTPPRDTAPRDTAPHDAGPHDAAPRDTAPRDTGPRDTGGTT